MLNRIPHGLLELVSRDVVGKFAGSLAGRSDSSTGEHTDPAHGQHGGGEAGREGGARTRKAVHLATRGGIAAKLLVDAKEALALLDVDVVVCVEFELGAIVQCNVRCVTGGVRAE